RDLIVTGVQTCALPISPTAILAVLDVSQAALPRNLGTIASAYTHSAENYRYFITSAYQKYLGRTPDSSGLDYWTKNMQAGFSDRSEERRCRERVEQLVV